jgi:hypothetical protein
VAAAPTLAGGGPAAGAVAAAMLAPRRGGEVMRGERARPPPRQARVGVRRARETRVRLAAAPQTRRFLPRRGPSPAASHRPSRRASQKVRGSDDGARRGHAGRSVRGSEVRRRGTERKRSTIFSRRFRLSALHDNVVRKRFVSRDPTRVHASER